MLRHKGGVLADKAVTEENRNLIHQQTTLVFRWSRVADGKECRSTDTTERLILFTSLSALPTG
jgi:hypothetical protein